jgi:hypothetical protein
MNDPHRIPSTPEDILELYTLCIQHHGKNKKECQVIEKLYLETLKQKKNNVPRTFECEKR